MGGDRLWLARCRCRVRGPKLDVLVRVVGLFNSVGAGRRPGEGAHEIGRRGVV